MRRVQKALDSMQKLLGITFDNSEILSQALTHPSASNENKKFLLDNQRLEFLGDSVLALVITDLLFSKNHDFSEGDMSALRAEIVKGKTLAIVGRRLRLGEHMMLGRGEENGGGREKDSNIADCLEALIGAIYLDKGWRTVKSIILSVFDEEINFALSQSSVNNPKGELQKLSHILESDTPIYKTLRREGPDHAPVFESTVSINGKLVGVGEGVSKSDAEKEAAMQALEKLNG